MKNKEKKRNEIILEIFINVLLEFKELNPK